MRRFVDDSKHPVENRGKWPPSLECAENAGGDLAHPLARYPELVARLLQSRRSSSVPAEVAGNNLTMTLDFHAVQEAGQLAFQRAVEHAAHWPTFAGRGGRPCPRWTLTHFARDLRTAQDGLIRVQQAADRQGSVSRSPAEQPRNRCPPSLKPPFAGSIILPNLAPTLIATAVRSTGMERNRSCSMCSRSRSTNSYRQRRAKSRAAWGALPVESADLLAVGFGQEHGRAVEGRPHQP